MKKALDVLKGIGHLVIAVLLWVLSVIFMVVMIALPFAIITATIVLTAKLVMSAF